MREIEIENIVQQVMKLYLERMCPKVIFLNFSTPEEKKYKELYMEIFQHQGLEVLPVRTELLSWQKIKPILQRNVKAAYIEGVTIEECINLLENQARGDKMLSLMQMKNYMPVWISIKEFLEPFKNPSLEKTRQQIAKELNQRGYLLVGSKLPKHVNNSSTIMTNNNVPKKVGTNRQEIENKKFITLRDLYIREDGVLVIPKDSKTTMALEEYCREKGIEIRRT